MKSLIFSIVLIFSFSQPEESGGCEPEESGGCHIYGKIKFVEYGEDPRDAVLRELEEETGLRGTIVRLLDARGHPERDPRKHIVSIVYLVDAEGEPKGGDDAADARFWPIETVLSGELEIAGDHIKILRDWLG